EGVSIIPAGNVGGLTVTRNPTTLPTWEHLRDTAILTLGGRAADIVLGNGPNAGAEADLAEATTILLNAHERQGLREDLVFAPAFNIRSAATLKAVNAELGRLLDRAIAIVEADRDLTLRLADRLIAEKLLSGKEVVEILGPLAVVHTSGRSGPDP